MASWFRYCVSDSVDDLLGDPPKEMGQSVMEQVEISHPKPLQQQQQRQQKAADYDDLDLEIENMNLDDVDTSVSIYFRNILIRYTNIVLVIICFFLL